MNSPRTGNSSSKISPKAGNGQLISSPSTGINHLNVSPAVVKNQSGTVSAKVTVPVVVSDQTLSLPTQENDNVQQQKHSNHSTTIINSITTITEHENDIDVNDDFNGDNIMVDEYKDPDVVKYKDYDGFKKSFNFSADMDDESSTVIDNTTSLNLSIDTSISLLCASIRDFSQDSPKVDMSLHDFSVPLDSGNVTPLHNTPSRKRLELLIARENDQYYALQAAHN